METVVPHKPDGEGAAVIYDGECPFCSSYVRFVRLRDTVGPVKLLDARQGGPLVEEVLAAGYDLDEGMVLKYRGRYYHGADCMHMIALLSTRSSWFNRLNSRLAGSSRLITRLYPILRAGRNATLRLLGRRKIGHVAGGSKKDASVTAGLGSREVDRLES